MRYASLASIVFLSALPAMAQLESRGQNLVLPVTSPGATLTQEIGLSTVTISWNRPGVKGREVWGTDLVPYGGDLWRAGANENTTIAISHDCTINGQPVPAGTYGFHAIASEKDWTLIFSTSSTAWGSYSYNPEEDALRTTATPIENQHVEWLEYGVENLTDSSATVYLAWETKKVPFEIAFDTKEIVIKSIQDQLRGIPAFTWQGWYQAAQWAFDNEAGADFASEWIEQSLQRGENWMNLALKGRILTKAGNKEEGLALLNRALELAPENRKAGVQKTIDES